MNETTYPSDLTDEEWEWIKDLIPAAKSGGRPRTLCMRAVLNAIFYRTVRSFSKANPKFDFWRAKKGRFWPKLRPKRTIYTAVITAHEPPSVVTIGLPTKNNFSNFRRFNNL